MVSRGPQAKGDGVLGADPGAVAQCCDGTLYGGIVGKGESSADAELYIAARSPLTYLQQEFCRTEWPGFVLTRECSRRGHGDRTSDSFRMGVRDDGGIFRLTQHRIKIIGEVSPERRDSHGCSVAERTRPVK